MLSVALGDEVAARIAAHGSEGDKGEWRLVACHQCARPRQVTTVAGAALEAQAPQVDDTLADLAVGRHRESAGSWAGLTRNCKQHGVRGPPPVRLGRARDPPQKPIPSNPHSARSGLEPGSGHGQLGWPSSGRECSLAEGRGRVQGRRVNDQDTPSTAKTIP